MERINDGYPDYMYLKNELGDQLKIYYAGNCLYFELNNNKSLGIFTVDSNDQLYVSLYEMFASFKQKDAMHFMSLGRNINIFEWIGEGNGLPEARDRMVIEQRFGKFKIRLLKSKFNGANKKCRVGFSLTDSYYPEIAKAFDDMFVSSIGNRPKTKKMHIVNWV